MINDKLKSSKTRQQTECKILNGIYSIDVLENPLLTFPSGGLSMINAETWINQHGRQ